MSKISADHSSRAAYVYVRQSKQTNSSIIRRAVAANMPLRRERGRLGGRS
jgi:hypothetical protein